MKRIPIIVSILSFCFLVLSFFQSPDSRILFPYDELSAPLPVCFAVVCFTWAIIFTAISNITNIKVAIILYILSGAVPSIFPSVYQDINWALFFCLVFALFNYISLELYFKKNNQQNKEIS